MTTIAVSATTGQGLPELEQAILSHLGFGDTATESPFSARERHVSCLECASAALSETIQRFEVHQAGELWLRISLVHSHLSETTGAFGADDLLGEIFPHSASENKRCSIDEALGTSFATVIVDARCGPYRLDQRLIHSFT